MESGYLNNPQNVASKTLPKIKQHTKKLKNRQSKSLKRSIVNDAFDRIPSPDSTELVRSIEGINNYEHP
jgi:hypothetical protein